jgi:hypothetical protein
MKLGRLPPRYDPRTLRLAKYLTAALPPPPPSRDWSRAVKFPCGMMENDRIGDCTCAAAGHAVQVLTANTGGEQTIPDVDIEAAYEVVGGYKPGDPSTDNGAGLLDVLNLWRGTGIGGHQILAFVQVNPQNLVHIQTAIEYFGGCYIALELPLSAQNQPIWDVTPWGLQGQGTPGGWGGHAVWMPDYDATGFNVITWGERQRMTLDFQRSYCDESYCVVTQDFINKTTQATPDGLNLALLQQDLALITG